MNTKTKLKNQKVVLLSGIAILIVIASGIAFFTMNNGSDKDTMAARKVADQYLAYVQTCNLDGAKQLRQGGLSKEDEVSKLCEKDCKPFNFNFVKIYEPLKTDVIPGHPEITVKSVAFQYRMTCGNQQKPFMTGMVYNYNLDKPNTWQVLLDTSIGNPSAL